MLKDRQWNSVLGVALAVVLVLPAWADDSNDTVTRLEAKLTAQQQMIDQLQQQVSAAAASQDEAARTEAMKQQIREVLSEQEFRESLMPSVLTAGYDNGFFIKSTDDNFMMKINGLVQFRWQHYGTGSWNRYMPLGQHRDDRTGFDVQRLRMTFSGHAYDPNLTYKIQFGSDSPMGYDTGLTEGWVNYRFSDALQFKAGLFRIAGTRSSQTPHEGLQMVDRAVFDSVFSLGWGMGARFWGTLMDNQFEWYVDVVNSLGNYESYAVGRTITNDPAELDSNPAIAARLVWHAMGEAPYCNCEGDVMFSESPKLDIGMHYAFNDDQADAVTTSLPVPLPRRFLSSGAFGLTNTNGLQIHQFGLDTAFKYMGFSAQAEYAFRLVDVRSANSRPFSPWFMVSRQGDTTVQHGAYAQLGYFLPIPGMEKQLELVARVGGISAIANNAEGTWEYGAGLNYYLQGHNVKLQTDVTKIIEAPISNPYTSMANVNDDVLVWRVQLQLAF